MENILFNGKLSGFRIEHIRREKHYSMPINHFHEYYEIYYLLRYRDITSLRAETTILRREIWLL